MTSPSEIPVALKAKAEELGSQVIYCLAEGATKIILGALLQVRNEAIAEERERAARYHDDLAAYHLEAKEPSVRSWHLEQASIHMRHAQAIRDAIRARP